LLFTATYPTRVSALVLYGSYAKSLSTPDYPHGSDPALFEIGMRLMAELGPVRVDRRVRAEYAR
jgi:hypothetical protein